MKIKTLLKKFLSKKEMIHIKGGAVEDIKVELTDIIEPLKDINENSVVWIADCGQPARGHR